MFTVPLESVEYGVEEFNYDTLEEALSGMKRLTRSAKEHQKLDGIKRSVNLIQTV